MNAVDLSKFRAKDEEILAKDLKALQTWTRNRALKILRSMVRSKLLMICVETALRNGGRVSITQLVYLLEDEFTVARSPYPLKTYIEKINERYDLPIAIINEELRFDHTKV